MAKYPILQVIGGDLMILDGDVRLFGGNNSIRSDDEFEPFSSSEILEFVHTTLPGAKMNGTMIAPAVQQMRTQLYPGLVFARQDETDDWIYSVSIMRGHGFSSEDDNMLRLLVPGSSSGSSGWGEALGDQRTVMIPSVDETGNLGELAAAPAYHFEIVGTYQQPSHGNTMMPLSTLQRLTGIHDQISWAGVAISNPLMVEDSKALLAKALAERMPNLQVLSADDLGKVMIADFDRLERTASYYTPVMILASVLVVVVTALAISQSRRRELILLRTIGVCAANVRVLFVAECTAVACLGAVAGTVASLLLGAAFFRGYMLNLIPGAAAIAVTLLVAVLVFDGRKGREFAELLRNP